MPLTFALLISWVLGTCVCWCAIIHTYSTRLIMSTLSLKQYQYPFLDTQVQTIHAPPLFENLYLASNSLEKGLCCKGCKPQQIFLWNTKTHFSKIILRGLPYKESTYSDTNAPSSFTLRDLVSTTPKICNIFDTILTWILSYQISSW